MFVLQTFYQLSHTSMPRKSFIAGRSAPKVMTGTRKRQTFCSSSLWNERREIYRREHHMLEDFGAWSLSQRPSGEATLLFHTPSANLTSLTSGPDKSMVAVYTTSFGIYNIPCDHCCQKPNNNGVWKKVLELSVCAGMWGLSFAESGLMQTIFLVPQFPHIVNGNVPVS